MKYLFVSILLITFTNLKAQVSEKEAVHSTIETFFEGFHQQDSTTIKQTVSEDIVLQTIAKNKEGHAFVKTENFSGFLKSIVGIPATTKFQEKIKSYSIQVDGRMANAWTPYEFWVNDTFSHCGVNSFQLFKDGENWKIIYLIDTRRKGECD